MYIDFHTHILPNIDDGPSSIEMSLEMLTTAEKNGAEMAILTPHVKASSDFDEFLCVRNERYNQLRDTIRKNGIICPELLLGSEVLLDASLSEKENVRSLCIEGTELLLLEFPYTKWNSWYNHEIYSIISKHEITPIIAHIERYISSPKDMRKLDALVSFGVKFQVNASSFLSFRGRRIIRELAAHGLVSAIASDAHNISNRSTDISRALHSFEKKFGDEFIDYMYDKTTSLLEEYACK